MRGTHIGARGPKCQRVNLNVRSRDRRCDKEITSSDVFFIWSSYAFPLGQCPRHDGVAVAISPRMYE